MRFDLSIKHIGPSRPTNPYRLVTKFFMATLNHRNGKKMVGKSHMGRSVYGVGTH